MDHDEKDRERITRDLLNARYETAQRDFVVSMQVDSIDRLREEEDIMIEAARLTSWTRSVE
jgi:hypothetical protein